ncbi:MAG: tripartite tricarboxylate transporter substrate binding protein [Rhizobiales bacterium]|nr:tripartite tricarboxylate transporter substrate binding protein [Hyphomicrobiales bacterium]
MKWGWVASQALVAAAMLQMNGAAAQTYPTRQIELIIPWVAGGGVDIVGRSVAAAMGAELGQNFVVLNRDGAAGTIGFNALSGATPDGYTLGGGPTTPIANAPYLVKGTRYTVESFDYICQYFENVFALTVRDDSRFKSMQELLAAAKADPGKLTYGHAGPGTIPHLAAENVGLELGIKFQPVPFRGDAQLLPVLLKGDVDFGSVALASLRGQKVRPLLVFADKRHPAFPDVPIASEVGVATSVPPGHNGMFGPKGLPNDVRQKLETACGNAVKGEAVQKSVTNVGGLTTYLSSEDFRKQTVTDYKFKGDLMRKLGLEAK